ncbi:MAG TPA: glycosyltransferase [Myxococcaceae bacterium]|nr:glycosyltransferase [Myxococcaceae bacterium]
MPGRILMAAQATVGHTNALRSIGRALVAGGHAVAMALPVVRAPAFAPEMVRTAAAIPDAVRGDGIEVIALRPSWSAAWHALQVARSTGYEELRHALGLFTAGLTGHARALAEAARSWRADVIVADYLFFAGWLAARLAKLPCAALFHSALPFPSIGGPPFGSGLPSGAPRDAAWAEAQRRLDEANAYAGARIRGAARRLGVDLPPGDIISRPYSGDLNLLTTLPELEPGLAPLDGPVVFTGPCTAGRAQERPDDPSLSVLRDGVRRIYVSLGTVFNSKPETFAAILRGLDDEGQQVVVSAGASARKLSEHPPARNCHIFTRVPQVALLERVDAVVTHGGNNTTQETLAAGKPMLVIPFGGDQLENARRIERLGAGIALLPPQVSGESVRAAMARLRSEPAFQEAAAGAARALGAAGGTRRAADAVLALIARR